MMDPVGFNASHRRSGVAEWKGGGWEVVVTAAGQTAVQGGHGDSIGTLEGGHGREPFSPDGSHGQSRRHTYRQ